MPRRGHFMATYHDGRKRQNGQPSVEAATVAENRTGPAMARRRQALIPLTRTGAGEADPQLLPIPRLRTVNFLNCISGSPCPCPDVPQLAR